MMTTARIGNIEVIAVTDGDAPRVDPSWPFPDVPAEGWNHHLYALDNDGRHRSNFGSFVLRTPDATILVDTGLGPHAPARFGTPPAELPHNLTAAGIQPGDISIVVLTHLHYDHVGWSLSEDGHSPFFPNARYVASKVDWDYWQTCEDPERAEHVNTFTTRFEPLSKHGVLDFVEGEELVAQGVRTLPTPGHTPGHMSLLLESDGQRGVVTGDVFHSSAQFAEPDWSHRADVDPHAARETRKALLSRLVPGMVIASGHLVHGSNVGTVAIIEGLRFWRGFGDRVSSDEQP